MYMNDNNNHDGDGVNVVIMENYEDGNEFD